jgi:acyl-coenzyme A synthetase/AMP-(fatty) acid ligase
MHHLFVIVWLFAVSLSYVVYGPLLNAVTTFLFESTPVYPDPVSFNLEKRMGDICMTTNDASSSFSPLSWT